MQYVGDLGFQEAIGTVCTMIFYPVYWDVDDHMVTRTAVHT